MEDLGILRGDGRSDDRGDGGVDGCGCGGDGVIGNGKVGVFFAAAGVSPKGILCTDLSFLFC